MTPKNTDDALSRRRHWRRDGWSSSEPSIQMHLESGPMIAAIWNKLSEVPTSLDQTIFGLFENSYLFSEFVIYYFVVFDFSEVPSSSRRSVRNTRIVWWRRIPSCPRRRWATRSLSRPPAESSCNQTPVVQHSIICRVSFINENIAHFWMFTADCIVV